jgi:hypothetical protein
MSEWTKVEDTLPDKDAAVFIKIEGVGNCVSKEYKVKFIHSRKMFVGSWFWWDDFVSLAAGKENDFIYKHDYATFIKVTHWKVSIL